MRRDGRRRLSSTNYLSIVVVVFLVGCGGNSGRQTDSTGVSQEVGGPRSASRDVSDLAGETKFKDADGNVVFSIKPKDNGAKLVDANEEELARFTYQESKLKVKAPDDTVLGYVTATEGRYKVKDSAQRDMFEFQQQIDGDWKLKDVNDELIYRVKPRSYGFEIEDVNDESLFKIKAKDGKTSLRNSMEETVMSTKQQISTFAMVPLGFEAIESLPMRTALAAAIIVKLSEKASK